MTRTTNNSTAILLDDPPPAATPLINHAVDASDLAHRPQKKLLPVLAPAPPPLNRPIAIQAQPAVAAVVVGPASPPISPTSPGAPRRGRKPAAAGAVSRSAREAARKTNHSRIEKLRREKINDALASLRDMVPYDEVPNTDPKKNNGEKEFKLEVLERTVSYLRKLKERVHELEIAAGIQPNAPVGGGHVPTKVARAPVMEDIEDDEQDELESENPSMLQPSPHISERTSSSRSPSSIRLPPISSFLPDEPLSPPNSGRSQPWQPSGGPPPTLNLPSAYNNNGGSRNSSASSSRIRSTPERRWTKDDETVASMLVQFSAERSSLSPRGDHARPPPPPIPRELQATPASILGMDMEVRERKRQRQA